MASLAILLATLIAPLALTVPTPRHISSRAIEDVCTAPEVLQCCNGTIVGGVADEADATVSGCKSAPTSRNGFGLTPARMSKVPWL